MENNMDKANDPNYERVYLEVLPNGRNVVAYRRRRKAVPQMKNEIHDMYSIRYI